MTAPLEGIRVLDLSRLLPGPYCTLILAELGADVVKLEDTLGGDYLRIMPPFKDGMNGAFYALNRGKRSAAIDLKRPEGRELLLRLLPRFDVVVESFRPGVLERLQLGYEQLAAVHPGVILCSISGYGQTGPLRERAGHDIDYLALAGVLDTIGRPGEPPVVPGVQLADVAGGALWAAIRILAALFARDRSDGPGGAHLDVSMTEGVLSFLVPWFGELAFGGKPVRRGASSLNGGLACYGAYATGDARALAVGALEPKFWGALCAAVGQQADMSDPVAPPERQQALREELQQRLAAAGRDEWAERLAPADACVEPVLAMEEVPAHPQHQARGMFFTQQDPQHGPLSLLRLPLEPVRATAPAPTQGQHTDELLGELGLSGEEIAALRAARVVR